MENTLNLKNQSGQDQAPKYPYRWKAHEYLKQEKPREWFWTIGIIAAGISIVSFVVGNFLFGILIILMVFLIFTYQTRDPREHDYAIHKRGVQMGSRLFEYAHLHSFWIFEHENGERELSIISHKTFIPHIKIPLGNADQETIRELLLQSIPEKHQEESLTDVLARWLGL